MNEPRDVVGLPRFVELESRLIADLAYRRFVHFRWNDQDIWLIGSMVWHHILSLGSAYLRCATDRMVHKTPIWVNPRAEPIKLKLGTGHIPEPYRSAPLEFVGFDPRRIVDIEIVRADHDYLGSGGSV